MSKWDTLVEIINTKAERSGFVRIDEKVINQLREQAELKQPDILASSFFPTQTQSEHVWYSDYALISLHHVTTDAPSEFTRQTLAAERYLDALLVGLEMPGTALDGYLILAFQEDPVQLNMLITDTEQNTRLVRKHVVTFKEGAWNRVERIGVLALNEVGETVAVDQPSGISEEGLALISELEYTAPTTLAQQHAAKWGDAHV
ncbi:hypothetical protein NFB56_09360 [Yersinia ruckeri]|uniref:hypothetical protein n=1 Tax=Yersinia ruckeri TaxID=29486 RepID=UPI0020C1707D|nr:hypothetical protein [Yersinia ruckeri]EKN3345968.1 hypothetical protein [Yersinia ruckeri]ELM3745604.1 hypothetical protein [Yersinia ruckeri]MCK8562358.1 hypothetical protein [Yersinia ruckeri]MCW6549063.1 hypothetical protein [Yersinia ruckeri]MCW6633226.1 hypothetical protein [Yersinia ruckeri]